MYTLLNTGLKAEVIEKIGAILQLHPEVRCAILYGSRAKGNFKPFSDIDITLFGDALTLTIQQKVENELDDLMLPYKFDLSIYKQIKNKELTDHIARVGKVIYGVSPLDQIIE